MSDPVDWFSHVAAHLLLVHFSEIITTSSWRAGQELILRELGPARKKNVRLKDNRDEGGYTGLLPSKLVCA